MAKKAIAKEEEVSDHKNSLTLFQILRSKKTLTAPA
jgi:hypothetical protein